MPSVSRTLGPLHFEDLEPKRFEDLARQLIYDFRTWRRLEATGRSGTDDGFDARGYEIVGGVTAVDPEESDANEEVETGTTDRLWLVQCKRERTITPKKLMGYLDDIQLVEGEKLHGIVFTAACDFSKTARDQFRDKCKAMGINDWHLWGKAELEDRLFLPENDGLLFAYFGVSLTIRRRSQRSELRAKLVMKRKANRLLGSQSHSFILLRSPDATQYPYDDEIPNFKAEPLWVLRQYRGITRDGLSFCLRRHFAYLSDDGLSWDAAQGQNDARPSPYQNPWATEPEADDDKARSEVMAVWEALPEANRGWVETIGIVRFEDILDIDELGDDLVKEPHVYAPFEAKRGPFKYFFEKLETIERFNSRAADPNSKKLSRAEIFPAKYRMPKVP